MSNFIINPYRYVAAGGADKKIELKIQKNIDQHFPMVVHDAMFDNTTNNNEDFWDHVQSDGGNIKFFTDSALTPGNEMPFELVKIDSTNKYLVGYVKMDAAKTSSSSIWLQLLSGGSETQPLVTASNGRNAVWDTIYWAVYHDMTTDSTGAEATLTTGAAGAEFDNRFPSREYTGIDGDAQSLGFGTHSDDLCVTVLLNQDAKAEDYIIQKNDDSAYFIRTNGGANNYLRFHMEWSGGDDNYVTTTSSDTSAWRWLAHTTQQDTGTPSKWYYSDLTETTDLSLNTSTVTPGGNLPTRTQNWGAPGRKTTGSDRRTWDGLMSGLRLSPNYRGGSAQWLTNENFCYNNPKGLAKAEAAVSI